MALDGQMVEKGFNFSVAHFSGMALAIKQDELLNPVAVSTFGIATVIVTPTDDGNLVEQLGAGGNDFTP